MEFTLCTVHLSYLVIHCVDGDLSQLQAMVDLSLYTRYSSTLYGSVLKCMQLHFITGYSSYTTVLYVVCCMSSTGIWHLTTVCQLGDSSCLPDCVVCELAMAVKTRI